MKIVNIKGIYTEIDKANDRRVDYKRKNLNWIMKDDSCLIRLNGYYSI